MIQDQINKLIEKGELPLASPYLFSTHLNLMALKSPLTEVRDAFTQAAFRVALMHLCYATQSVGELLGKDKKYFCGILIPLPGSKFSLMAGLSSEDGDTPHLWFVPRGAYDSEFEPNATPVKYLGSFPQEITATVEGKQFDALFVSEGQPLYELLIAQEFYFDSSAPVGGDEDFMARASLTALLLKNNLLELFKPGVLLNKVTSAQIILPSVMELIGRFLSESRYQAALRHPELVNTWAAPLANAFNPLPSSRANLSAWLSPTAKLTGTPQPALAYRNMAKNGEIPEFEGDATEQWVWPMPDTATQGTLTIDDLWQQITYLWDETEGIPALKRIIEGFSLVETNPRPVGDGMVIKYQLTQDLNPQSFFIEKEEALALAKNVNEVSGDDANQMDVGPLSAYPPELLRKFALRTAGILLENFPSKPKDDGD